MNNLHLICAAVLDTARAGGLQEMRAEALFNRLSAYFSKVPQDRVEVFEENVQRILDATPDSASSSRCGTG